MEVEVKVSSKSVKNTVKKTFFYVLDNFFLNECFNEFLMGCLNFSFFGVFYKNEMFNDFYKLNH